MTLRHVAQGTAGAEIGYGRPRRTSEHIVAHRHQRIFFAEHSSVLAEDGQTVYVGVYGKAHVGSALRNQCREVGEVFRQRFGVVRKPSVRLAVHGKDFAHAQRAAQVGHNQTAHRVDAVNGHPKARRTNGVYIDGVQCQYLFNMIGRVIGDGHTSQRLDTDKGESVRFGQPQHFAPLVRIQKFALRIQQFQRIPVCRIMAGGDDDASGRTLARYSQFYGRRGGHADVRHVKSHAREDACDNGFHHFAGDARIASNHNPLTRLLRVPTDKGSVCRREFYDGQRVQSLCDRSADGSPDAGDGFYKSHSVADKNERKSNHFHTHRQSTGIRRQARRMNIPQAEPPVTQSYDVPSVTR